MFDTDIEDDHQIGQLPPEPTDPLRYNAMTGAYVAQFIGTVLSVTNFGFADSRIEAASTERMLGVGSVGIREAPVDLDGALSDAEGSDAEIQFEADDRAVIASPAGPVAGLTTDAIVVAPAGQSGATALLRDILDSRTGASQPKYDVGDSFASLPRRADTTRSVAGGYAPERDLSTMIGNRSVGTFDLPTDGFGSATGALFAMTLDNGSEPQPASATITYPAADAIDGETLTSSLGSAAQRPSYTRADQTVRVTGTYSWESVSAFEGTAVGGL